MSKNRKSWQCVDPHQRWLIEYVTPSYLARTGDIQRRRLKFSFDRDFSYQPLINDKVLTIKGNLDRLNTLNMKKEHVGKTRSENFYHSSKLDGIEIERDDVTKKPRTLKATWSLESETELRYLYSIGKQPWLRRIMESNRFFNSIFNSKPVMRMRKKFNICWGVEEELCDTIADEIREEIDQEILSSIRKKSQG
ncbi:MAG: hypothetical protein R3230_00130 [Nitrosopumilaceae archaeon]|nr:hypothetical protein [Nitrosopumilaceae archaeon]